MPVAALETYKQKLIDINNIRKRMEFLFKRRRIYLRDIEMTYESLFLRAVTGFESFCEQLFFDIIHGNVRYSPADVEPWVKSCAPERLRAIVFHGSKYLDWIPFEDKSNKRSELFLDGGKPFTTLIEPDRQMIRRIVVIRHAIAHTSDHAINRFKNEVIRGIALLPREKTPAGFLRSMFRTAPAQRRFENYAAELGVIATKLSGSPRWTRRT